MAVDTAANLINEKKKKKKSLQDKEPVVSVDNFVLQHFCPERHWIGREAPPCSTTAPECLHDVTFRFKVVLNNH